MGYLIDTNILSELRKKDKANKGVVDWFKSVNSEDCYVSVLTIGEIKNGIERLKLKDSISAINLEKWLNELKTKFNDRILPIDSATAIKWGEISAISPLPVIDTLIASSAIINDLIVVSRNVKDIERTSAKFLNPFA